MSKSISSSPPYLKISQTQARGRVGLWAGILDASSVIFWGAQRRIAKIVHQRSLRRLELDLERIDDRMLKDIGLDRSEIRRVVQFGREF